MSPSVRNSKIQSVDQWKADQWAIIATEKSPETGLSGGEQYGPIEKPRCWFLISYISVTFLVLGIITVLVGAILRILKWIKFETHLDGKDYHYYFGKKIPKYSGACMLFVGLMLCLVSGIFYWMAIKRIDQYIKKLEAATSKEGPKKKRKQISMQSGDSKTGEPEKSPLIK